MKLPFKMPFRMQFKRLLPRSLFGRSLLILVLPVLLIQLITAYVFVDRHWSKMTDRLAYAVAGEIAVVADTVEQGADRAQLDRISGYAAQELGMLITFDPGARFDDADEPEYRSFLARTLHNALDSQVRREHDIHVDVEEKWVDVTVRLSNGVLHVSLPQRRLFSSTSYIFLLWMVGTSTVLLSIAVLFMRNQIRPIRRLALAAERFGKGLDIQDGFKPEGAREVRQAARAFIDMQERIRRQVQQRTAMLAGVSHDLRTPLTRMKLQIAMLGSSADAAALKKDVDDMERMINAYLDFARGQGGEAASRADIGDMLERIAAGARRQGVDVALEKGDGDLEMQVRPVAMERCLSNVVGNAGKYASHVRVRAERTPLAVRIVVDDDGPGIPEAHYEDVFKPFVRGEPSRNPETGGVGLGLPIAQDVIHGHGGTIRLDKSPMGGLRVLIDLPV